MRGAGQRDYRTEERGKRSFFVSFSPSLSVCVWGGGTKKKRLRETKDGRRDGFRRTWELSAKRAVKRSLENTVEQYGICHRIGS